jgi:5-methylcytosine-specific restriction endonuclease McrA
MTYSEKLKDPRWQRKRLRVFDRAKWKCEKCGDSKTELHVHHTKYSGNPWDVPLSKLQCLCSKCHGAHHNKTRFVLASKPLTMEDKTVTQDEIAASFKLLRELLIAEPNDGSFK